MSTDNDLARLRDEIRAVDRALVELTAKRLALARQVGEIKQQDGQPIRNYSVEAEAMRLVREAADKLGVPRETAESLLKLEIRESLRVQERDRVRRARTSTGDAGRAIVIGGAGRMGRWFVEFLESKGYACRVIDPAGPERALPDGPLAADVILLAAPPSESARVLDEIAGRTGRALVLDIASLKTPLAGALRKLASSGARVASIHPMWGPATDLLADKNVVVLDCGDAEAAEAAAKLFEDTAARVTRMPLDEHDRFMGIVLGLPHALNLAFGHALATGATTRDDVATLGGPTFQKQLAVAREVANENKDLYFEIQKLNPHTPDVLRALQRSLEDMEAALRERSEFRRYMTEAQAWFEDGDAKERQA